MSNKLNAAKIKRKAEVGPKIVILKMEINLDPNQKEGSIIV